jgi:hypothetical protein
MSDALAALKATTAAEEPAPVTPATAVVPAEPAKVEPATPAPPPNPVAAAAQAEVARRENAELAKLRADLEKAQAYAEKAKKWDEAAARARLAPEAVLAGLGVDDKVLDQYAKRHLLRRLGDAAPEGIRNEAAQLEAAAAVAQIEGRVDEKLGESARVIAELQAQLKARDEADLRRQAEAEANTLIQRATTSVTPEHRHLHAFAKSKPETLDAAVRQAAATLYQETGRMPEAAAVTERAEKSLADQFAPLLALLQPQQSTKAEPQQPASITLGAGAVARQPLAGPPPETASTEERMNWALKELQAGRLVP